jgi:hypothetical protein
MGIIPLKLNLNQKILLMKKNFSFIKKPKSGWIAFLLLFFGLFANTVSA